MEIHDTPGRRRALRARPHVLILVACSLALGGCAGGGSGGGSARGSTNRITSTELENLQHLDAYEAIRRLRPTWLQTRTGAAPGLILNGNAQMSGLDLLRTLSVSEVTEMRFMDAGDATTRFGTGYVSGAILVTTR